jgi:hypothetical protein
MKPKEKTVCLCGFEVALYAKEPGEDFRPASVSQI